MFDDMISMEQKQSPVDALLRLLDSEDRDSKTLLEMAHIKFQIRSRWLFLVKYYKHESLIWKQEKLLEFYKSIMTSYQGFAWIKVVEGIKEMKPQLLDANIQQGLQGGQ